MVKFKLKKSKLTVTVLGMILIFSMTLLGCSDPQQTVSEGDAVETQTNKVDQLLIYTSVYPVYFYTQQIAGERAEVKNLIPAGAEPHDFEPTAKDIIELSKADLFIYNGGGFETWIEKIVESVNNDKMVIVDTTANIRLLNNDETGNVHEYNDDAHSSEEDHDHDNDAHGTEEDHGHDNDAHGTEEDHGHDNDAHAVEVHDEDHSHAHGEMDPHVWLDPQLAKQQAEEIKDALVQFDPDHAKYYEENYQRLAQHLDELDATFLELSENIVRRDFIVAHAAYGYLANRYKLNQIPISGLNPSNEPSARELQEIIEFAQENKVQYILFENTINTKIAQVVKESIGAEALVLHNLEFLTEEEISQGKDYFSIMNDNLGVLKKALGYKK